MTKYKIKSWKEETQCDWCAYALYYKDYAYLDEKLDKVFCSEFCQKKYLEEQNLNTVSGRKKRKR